MIRSRTINKFAILRFVCSFDYFKDNEGKNISNTIGLIVKYAYVCGMLRHEQGIHCVRYIVSVIKFELKTTTRKFTYFPVEEFGTTDSITSRDKCPINGIMKLHSLVTQDDKVILLPYICTNCTVSMICHKWKTRKELVKPSDASLGNDNDSILKDKIELQDTDDKGQTDNETDDDSSGDDNDRVVTNF